MSDLRCCDGAHRLPGQPTVTLPLAMLGDLLECAESLDGALDQLGLAASGGAERAHRRLLIERTRALLAKGGGE